MMYSVSVLHTPSPRLTHVLKDPVPLQLGVSDFALKHHQLLLVLLFERVQTSLAVLQLVDKLLLDGDLAGDVGQICLVVLCQTHTHGQTEDPLPQ